jgi:hypothetical protein
MIHYHGGPASGPFTASMAMWQARHAMVSFANPDLISLAAEICQSFALDNGAFSFWKGGDKPDWDAYYTWVDLWGHHPSCDFIVIPDVIDGTEHDNDLLLDHWFLNRFRVQGVPVWHLHEDLGRLRSLSFRFDRIALGSTAEYATVGTMEWWARIADAMKEICDDEGRPRCKLHGLRMLNPAIFSYLPLSSADSSNVARNIGLDKKWDTPYSPRSREVRALVLADRIERHAAAARWPGLIIGEQMNLELIG